MIWEVNSLSVSLSVFVIICTLWITGKFLNEDAIYIYESSLRRKKHSWKTIRYLKRAFFCSICEILVPSNGFFCECCGICSDISCIAKAEQSLKCKEKQLNQKVQKHLWVLGNLPIETSAVCEVCQEEIDSHLTDPGLDGFRCAWCQRLVHTNCFEDKDEECDFGDLKDCIVPPKSMVVARSKGAPKLHLTGIKAPRCENWTPLIVIANPKSGSSEAKEVISAFRFLLNPLQVMELGQNSPADALQWAVLSPAKCRVLVAGGDGTVGWVLNTIADLLKPYPEKIPEVAILPLGTGNDLARVLGWGAGGEVFDGEPLDRHALRLIHQIRRAEAVQLDRWSVDFHKPSRLPFRTARRHSQKFMFNYFSVGVDALVTLNFHKARSSSLYLVSNRAFNKILYFFFGGHQVLLQDCQGMAEKIELFLDDKKVDLPDVQSLIFTNIDSWGSGVKLFDLSREDSDTHSQSYSDGILEVYGITSSFHIAQLQVGLSRPLRLGTARRVTVKLNATLPMQVDGEPWLQTPCDIHIQKDSEATMLRCTAN